MALTSFEHGKASISRHCRRKHLRIGLPTPCRLCRSTARLGHRLHRVTRGQRLNLKLDGFGGKKCSVRGWRYG